MQTDQNIEVLLHWTRLQKERHQRISTGRLCRQSPQLVVQGLKALHPRLDGLEINSGPNHDDHGSTGWWLLICWFTSPWKLVAKSSTRERRLSETTNRAGTLFIDSPTWCWGWCPQWIVKPIHQTTKRTTHTSYIPRFDGAAFPLWYRWWYSLVYQLVDCDIITLKHYL